MRVLDRLLRSRVGLPPGGLVVAAAIVGVMGIFGCATSHPVSPVVTREQEDYVRRKVAEVDFERALKPGGDAAFVPPVTPQTDRSTDQPLPMTLYSAIRIAIENSTILRQDAQFLSYQNPLMNSPDATGSAIDPSIQSSSIAFGNRGPAAALGDFAPRLSAGSQWGRNESVQNSPFDSGVGAGSTLTDETGAVFLRMDKLMANGGTFTVSHNINYSQNNVPSRVFPSAYSGNLSFNYSHPLLAGSGTEFTQIAGPSALMNPNNPQLNQGVVIARINNELARIDFEQNLRQVAKDTADVYWDLYLSHQRLAAEREALSSFESTWDKEKADLGAGRGGAAQEAQAASSYYASKSRVEDAESLVSTVETRLRRLLSLPPADGMMIVPVDQPDEQVLPPNWEQAYMEAVATRPELRRTKWNVRSLQLQVKAARNLARPRLDFVAGYTLNGFGDKLMSAKTGEFDTGNDLHNYYGTLTRGEQTGWNLGLVASVPIGFRQERAQIANLELRLAKSKAFLKAQEMEVSHELTFAYQTVRRWEQVSAANRERREAVLRQVDALQSEFDAGRGDLDLLLRAKGQAVDASIEHLRSMAELGKAINDVMYRKGSLLQDNQIHVQYDALADASDIDEDDPVNRAAPRETDADREKEPQS